MPTRRVIFSASPSAHGSKAEIFCGTGKLRRSDGSQPWVQTHGKYHHHIPVSGYTKNFFRKKEVKPRSRPRGLGRQAKRSKRMSSNSSRIWSAIERKLPASGWMSRSFRQVWSTRWAFWLA